MKKRYYDYVFSIVPIESYTIFDMETRNVICGFDIINLLNKYYNTILSLKAQNRQLNDIVMKFKN